ncbi:PAS domain-containing protein [Kiloniella antarctica]|uniref:PAS domain-containing protein n=1 Tax=Kiloniella antarctica TaxID=1550907 RepID=A0ABW5BEZ0_9PROT
MSLYSQDGLKEWGEKTRALYEYWLSIHPSDTSLPGRQHLDPVDIPNLLPNVWLVDIFQDPIRFKFRLFGTAHVEAMKHDYTGRWIDEVYPNFLASSTYPDYMNLAENAQPSYRIGPASFHIPDYKSIERVMLPLAHNGKSVDMILALTVYL